MIGTVVCVLFVLMSVAFLDGDANRQPLGLESRVLDRKRRSLLNDAEKAEVVKAHNDLRRKEGSSNMEIMSWNDILATMADTWAGKCINDHNETFLVPPSSLGYGRVGQNVHVTTAQSINVTAATLGWYNEKSLYIYDTGDCPTKKCGHYTQVVWASSRLIGCAYNHCDKVVNTSFTNAIVFVCNYAPAGNFIGQKPFKKGSPCTECASSSSGCNQGLCDDGFGLPPIDTYED